MSMHAPSNIKHEHVGKPSTSKIQLQQERNSSRSSSRSKSSPEVIEDEKIILKLASPVGGEALTFYWPLRESPGYSEGQEILDVVKNVLSSFPELNFIVRQHCGLNLDAIDKKNFDQMSSLLEAFNKTVPAITQLWKGATKPGGEIWSAERADPVLLKQICTRAYNRAVDNVNHLNNHYKAFSSETYGETSYERLRMIIQEITPKERDVFVDLGSGVGQLVIQMAGGSRVRKAVGIEIASLPNKYAQNLVIEFKKWMKWYGKKFRPFEIFKGDFLDERFRELITKEATIIFINNYAFTADLETKIKRELLSDLKDGTRIISTKPYGHVNRSITDRHMNDISAILDVYEMSQCENACSWTGNYVPYYHHTINRAKLEKYFLAQRNPSLKLASNGSDESRRSSTSSKSRDSFRCWSRESSVSLPVRSNTPNIHTSLNRSHTPNVAGRTQITKIRRSISRQSDDDDYAIGPTTRSKWQEYCSTKTKRAHSTAVPVSANDIDPGDAGSEWSNRDSDYVPNKKIRKTGLGRGRPRKINLAKVVAGNTKETRNLVHEMTCTVSVQPLLPINHPSIDIISSIKKEAEENEITETIKGSKYPALNRMLRDLRDLFEMQLERMASPGLLHEIEAEIQSQMQYKSVLQNRIDLLNKQISSLLFSGTQNLYARMKELGIEATTPYALLDNAKEIVKHHKKISAECAALENEVTILELANKQLEMKVFRRNEDPNLVVNINTVPSINPLVASNVSDNYQTLAGYHKKLSAKGSLVCTKSADYSISNDSSAQQSQDSLSSTDLTIQYVVSNASSYAHQVNSGTLGTVKRSRCRPNRGGQSNKRIPSSSVKILSDPKEAEEMEKRIQDIVAKALEVDSAAKCAEKERRARGEKRRDKLPTVSTLSTSRIATLHRVNEKMQQSSGAVELMEMKMRNVNDSLMKENIECEGSTTLHQSSLAVAKTETDSIRSDDE